MQALSCGSRSAGWLLALAAFTGCAVAVPNVGDASITCKVDTDCLAGEYCDTEVSPSICVGLNDGGGTTSGTTSSTSGTASAGSTSGGVGTSGTSGTTSGGGCAIGDAGFASGATNPADDCQSCEPDVAAGAWSNLSDGITCTSDGGNVCQGGVCTTACVIDGGIVPVGAVSALNPCTVCNPDAGIGAYTPANDLSFCSVDGGNLCVAGSCMQGCAIDGGFVAQWTFENPLQAACCNSKVGASGWTRAFSAASSQLLPLPPQALTVADFNGDGLSDFAVTDLTPEALVYVANPSGIGFSLETSLATGVDPVAIVSADFNNDGTADLAVLSSAGSSSVVDLLYGDGGGGFADAGTLAALSSVQGLLATPLSGVSYPDVLVSETALGGQIAIYPNSSGQFAGSGGVPVTSSPAAMCAAEFRTVGTNDVAVIDNAGGGVSILLNESGGTVFRATAPFSAPVNASVLTSAALSGSALPGLVVAGDDGGAGIVAAYLSLGDGGFVAGPSANVSRLPAGVTTFLRAGASADTLATASGSKGTVDILIALDGGLVPSASYAAGQKANAIATGDFNGDGLSDLAVTDPSTSMVYILYGQCQ